MSKQTTAEHQTNNNSVADAERVLADLETQRRALIERGQETAETRKRISYAALADGDEKAKKALAQLDGEATAHAHQMQSLIAAIAEAEQRVVAARAAAVQAADRKRARELRAVLAEFVECAVSLDEALTALAEEGHALLEVVSKMHTLGTSYPTHEQVRVFGTHAVLTALMATPWKRGFQTLAPNERRNIRELVDGWVATIERDVRARLGEGAETKEPEAA